MDNPFACLSYLSEEDRRQLLEHAVEVPFLPHSHLVHQGVKLECLMVVVHGHVAVQVLRPGDESTSRIDVAILGPGDLIGEMSFASGDLTSAHIVGVEAGQVLRIPFDTLHALMERDRGFGMRLYRSLAASLSRRVRDTTAKLPSLMVEEVAQVRPPRTTLTGRLEGDRVPEGLLRAIQGFKQAMLDLDLDLCRGLPPGSPRNEGAAVAAQLCDRLLGALSEAIAEAGEARVADAYGGHTLRETFGVLMQSRLADRAFSKPRGYAGDYYTLELIHDDQPQGDGRLGPLIDAWVLRTPSARGIRAQRRLLAGLLGARLDARGAGEECPYRVLSLGAGAGRELLDFMAGLRDPQRISTVRATCLDVDMEALAFSNYLAHCAGLEDRFQWIKANVTQLRRGRAEVRPALQDVIYSAGLIDYLEDEVVIDLLDWIHDHLEPGGLVMVCNADRACPDRALWEYLLDWRLRYRSADDLRALLQGSRFAESKIEVRGDESGATLLALAEK